MSDPAGQHSSYDQGYAGQPEPQQQPQAQPVGYGAAPPAGRYVPPTLDEIWYKATPNMLLFAVTCGLWGAAWAYRTHDDLQKHNGQGLGGAIGLVLGLLASIVIGFTVPMELEKAYNRNGWQSPVKATDGLYLLIPLAGPFIWYPKVQAALNSYWVSQGSRPAAA